MGEFPPFIRSQNARKPVCFFFCFLPISKVEITAQNPCKVRQESGEKKGLIFVKSHRLRLNHTAVGLVGSKRVYHQRNVQVRVNPCTLVLTLQTLLSWWLVSVSTDACGHTFTTKNGMVSYRLLQAVTSRSAALRQEYTVRSQNTVARHSNFEMSLTSGL